MKIIYGEDFSSIEKFIDKEYSNYIKLNAQSNLVDILCTVTTNNLFDGKINYLVLNANFLVDEMINEVCQEIIQKGDFFCNEIVWVVNSDTLTTSSLINTKIIAKSTLQKQEHLTLNEIKKYILFALNSNNIKIKDDDVDLICAMLPLKWGIIKSEVDKLIKWNDFIDKKLIASLITNYENLSIFDFINAFLSNNTFCCFSIYLHLKQNKIDEVEIINILASQLVALKMLKIYMNNNYSKYQIGMLLKMPAFFIKQYYHLLQYQNLQNINYALDFVYNLDLKIKQGLLIKEVAIKLLILSNIFVKIT